MSVVVYWYSKTNSVVQSNPPSPFEALEGRKFEGGEGAVFRYLAQNTPYATPFSCMFCEYHAQQLVAEHVLDQVIVTE